MWVILCALRLASITNATVDKERDQESDKVWKSLRYQWTAKHFGNNASSEHWDRTKAHHYFRKSIDYVSEEWGKAFMLHHHALYLTNHVHQCANTECHQPARHRCNKCKNTYYCSANCQIQHWTHHIEECDSTERVKLVNQNQAILMFEHAMMLEMEWGFTNQVLRFPSEFDMGTEVAVGQMMSRKSIGRSSNVKRITLRCIVSDDSVFSSSAYHLARLLSGYTKNHTRAMDVLLRAISIETGWHETVALGHEIVAVLMRSNESNMASGMKMLNVLSMNTAFRHSIAAIENTHVSKVLKVTQKYCNHIQDENVTWNAMDYCRRSAASSDRYTKIENPSRCEGVKSLCFDVPYLCWFS